MCSVDFVTSLNLAPLGDA